MNNLLVKENYRTSYFPEQNPKGSYSSYKGSYVSEPVKYDLTSANSKKTALPRESKLLCALLLCLILISVGIISLYGRIIAGNYQLEKMRREFLLLQEERESLQIEVKRLSSLERIENIAINDLGLQYPENRQWVVLSARGN